MDYVERKEDAAGAEAVGEFWRRVRAVSDFAVDYEADCGMLASGERERLKGEFTWYVPLRGFATGAMEDELSYLTGRHGDWLGSTVMRARAVRVRDAEGGWRWEYRMPDFSREGMTGEEVASELERFEREVWELKDKGLARETDRSLMLRDVHSRGAHTLTHVRQRHRGRAARGHTAWQDTGCLHQPGRAYMGIPERECV